MIDQLHVTTQTIFEICIGSKGNRCRSIQIVEYSGINGEPAESWNIRQAIMINIISILPILCYIERDAYLTKFLCIISAQIQCTALIYVCQKCQFFLFPGDFCNKIDQSRYGSAAI